MQTPVGAIMEQLNKLFPEDVNIYTYLCKALHFIWDFQMFANSKKLL